MNSDKNQQPTITCDHGHNVNTCMICEIEHSREIHKLRLESWQEMDDAIIAVDSQENKQARELESNDNTFRVHNPDAEPPFIVDYITGIDPYDEAGKTKDLNSPKRWSVDLPYEPICGSTCNPNIIPDQDLSDNNA